MTPDQYAPTDILRQAFEGKASFAGGILPGIDKKIIKLDALVLSSSDPSISPYDFRDQIKSVLGMHGYGDYEIEVDVKYPS